MKIINANNIFTNLCEYRAKGALRGVYLGFPNIHKHYSMALPGVTDWTGFPQSGKTQILMELLLNTSVFHGWKHLIYLPDVGSSQEIIADLIHKYTGKTFDKRYPNHITEEEIAKAIPFIDEHFKVLDLEDLNKRITPYEFWDLAAEYKKKYGICTASIDAWKDMSHKREKEFGRTDQYLENVLSYRNKMSEKHELHFHTIIHPTRTDKDAAGHRRPPTPYDMKGGTEWYNNAKNSITVHRPDGEDTMAEIFFNKIKPRSVGEVGYTTLNFDFTKFRYYNDDQGGKRFADPKEYRLAEPDNTILEDEEIPF